MTWQDQQLPEGHPTVRSGKIGVLLVNLGTPVAPTTADVRTYLAEFLSDKRVIEIPALVWQPILRGIILNTRPQKSAEAYRKVWSEDGSPLAAITKGQAVAMQGALGGDGRVMVDWAMRYGKPPIAERLEALRQQGCEKILVVPLYPQYAASTTATVNDKVFEAFSKMRWQPALRTAAPWHDDPVYVDALATSLIRHLDGLDFEPEVVLASFHGLPQSYLLKGDPYHCHCHKTARLLRERLGLAPDALSLSFQSRLGRMPWLQPYTEAHVTALAHAGVKQLDVICPGFAADCLETLEEVAIGYHETFTHAGGTALRYIPALNAEAGHIACLTSLVRTHLQGWGESRSESPAEIDARLAEVTRVLPGANFSGL